MQLASRWVLSLAVAGLLVTPVCADEIPSRHPEKSEAKDTVQNRLTEMGLPAAEAKARAAQLTEDEANYFARDTNRIQVVGQEQQFWLGQADPLWMELVLGVVALAGGITVLWIYLVRND